MADVMAGLQQAESNAEDNLAACLEAALGHYSVLDRRRANSFATASGADAYDQVSTSATHVALLARST